MNAPLQQKSLRCAIYTRVSSDSGLEQDFNSLDAQREAAEAYVKSQAHEGWKLARGQYNDGGYSGGSMDRPGLKSLLADIATKKIDIVVVYKVDRLTRSLADFAKLVELFDAQGVSFVSVTQSFNTTSSMGRLTLNVLLSFAQFEREVTGERIRDKIAASKKKGLWMGGVVPLGYRVVERKLLVDDAEAETVKLIFERYRDLKSIPALQADLRSRGVKTRVRALTSGKTVGGIALTNGPLSAILRNRVFLGEINHRENSYAGEHAPIIDRELFDAVQQIIGENRQGKRERHALTNALLAGKLFDDRGNRMSPSYAIKKGVRYRYYVSSVLAQGRKEEAGPVARVAAMEIEQIVMEAMKQALRSASPRSKPISDIEMTRDHIERIVVRPLSIEIAMTGTEQGSADDDNTNQKIVRVAWAGRINNPRREVLAPRGSDVSPSPAMRSQPRAKLIVAIAMARRWLDEILSGETDLDALARREGRSERHVRNTLSLAFLAPDIVKAAIAGRLPRGLGLTRLADPPMDWTAQRRQIGI